MNFFEAQDQARRSSRRLVFLYVLATFFIVAGVTAVVGVALFNFASTSVGYSVADFLQQQAPLLAGTAIAATVFILGSSLYKTSLLSSGGGRVAVDMGGTLVTADVQDPLRRRLRNVVEEIAIASSVPVPEIYVLEEEHGINAFAAGFEPSDAAIAVTRGTLEMLDRDELQGVIAHEFSHILNGDMKLNIRLMGVLFGIMVLGLVGRLIVRGGYHASIVSSRRDRGSPIILIIGLGLVIVGGIGVFFARIIKAGISRQREFLADASAVQFTRQNAGIANALKKIGGFGAGSELQATDPEEVSHMLFGSGRSFSALFATHPPLIDRIQALEPSFVASDFKPIDAQHRQTSANIDSGPAAFTGNVATAMATGGATLLADSIADTVGHPNQEQLQFAQRLRRSIPETLYHAAHSSEFAFLLAIALVLDRSPAGADRQFALLREQIGADRSGRVKTYYAELTDIGHEYRLPLLEIAFPALKLRPSQELAYLVSLATRLIEIDGQVELYEYCFYRIMMSNLGQAIDPTGRRAAARSGRRELRAATLDLLRSLADYGHQSDADRASAFAAGVATLDSWAHDAIFTADRHLTVAVLDRSLDILLGLNSRGQESLLRAISVTAGHDGTLSTAEAELIRAVCATLNYPLPPILVRRFDT